MDKNDKTEINYLYFSFFLLFLIAITCSHFLRMNQPIWGTPLFFFLYAMGQALLEVFCFMLLGYALHRWMPKWTFKLYIGLSFCLLLAHFANYTLVRLMDVSLSYFFNFFFGCGLDHFRVAFLAMNMHTGMIALIIGAILLVPFFGIFFYWLTYKVSLKKPLILSQRQIFFSIAGISILLLTIDIIAKPYLTCGQYSKYTKTLPLGSTFLAPTPCRLSLPAPIQHARKEADLQRFLSSSTFEAAHQPFVFLFVIETLRRDFVTFEIAPHLSAFAEEHLAPRMAFSNANATHLSWFSIFHSCFPFHWTEVRDECGQGSIPLQIFKKLGYQIRVYSSADLAYFNMDQIVFGKNRHIADSVQEYSMLRQIEPCDRDALAVRALWDDVQKEQKPTLFIVFLDATHSEYSSPQDFPHPFQPAADSIDYLAISRSSNDLELLKNRYRNAIYWVDHLIGGFFQNLKKLNLYDDALIVLTGDHGEEFFEEGALFHGTHLNEWQTRVPIFYKFPGPMPDKACELTSHLDIFPSILHFITGETHLSQYFDGQSIFASPRWPFVLSMQHNGPDIPYEFSLSDGHNRIQARFLNPPQIHTVPGIELICMETESGREMAPNEEMVQPYFPEAFAPFITR